MEFLKSMNRLRTFSCFLILMISCLSPAPIQDQRPLTPTPEQSQQQLAAQQNLNGKIGVVGTETQDTEVGQIKKIVGNSDAARTVADSERRTEPSSKNKSAEDALAASNRTLSKQKSKQNSFIIGLSILALGFGLVYGFRTWADKNTPELRIGLDAKEGPESEKFKIM